MFRVSLSQWYKQNRELKRRSTAIMQKFIQVQPDGALLDLLADETDAAQAAKEEDELEDLRNTVKRKRPERTPGADTTHLVGTWYPPVGNDLSKRYRCR